MNLSVFLKLLSSAYRKRRASVLRLRGIKRRHRFFRDPMAAYSWIFHTTERPTMTFKLTNITAPTDLY